MHRTPGICASDFRHRYQGQHREDVPAPLPARRDPGRRPEPAAGVSARAGRVTASHGGAGAFMGPLGAGRQPGGGDRRPGKRPAGTAGGGGQARWFCWVSALGFLHQPVRRAQCCPAGNVPDFGCDGRGCGGAAAGPGCLSWPAARSPAWGQVSRAVSGVAAGGLAAAGVAMSAAVRLAARWAGSALAADLLGAGTAVLLAVAWFVFPLLLSRGRGPARSGPTARGPAHIRRKGG